MTKELYDTLGVPEDASKADIRKAYKSLAGQHHPDREGGDIDQFKQIKAAFEVLYDEEARDRYDRTGETGTRPNLTQQAMSEVATLFREIVMQHINQLNRINPVHMCVDEMQSRRRKGEEMHRDLQDKIAKLELAKARIKSKNPLLLNTIDEQITNMRRTEEENEYKFKLIDKVLELLTEFEYEVEEMATYSNPFQTGTSTYTFTIY